MVQLLRRVPVADHEVAFQHHFWNHAFRFGVAGLDDRSLKAALGADLLVDQVVLVEVDRLAPIRHLGLRFAVVWYVAD